ncbi:KilA-N domain-containing protein [Methylobacterium sp. Leaf88]|uniref:KilA-N domain-containing protein n=1 Tax=Methylobacterium sp. Leaf88 TaxID=1736244 RepID=UPI000713C71F|nr:KilA-N domain-containing protein [Methylobacterium sp. Leaf88]KQO70642.1 hypothetical protein ASF20_19295 [Methylobacterium sp. Leaf88]
MMYEKRNLPAPLTYGGQVIHDQDAMVSLTDMWRAAGSPRQKTPANWRALPGSRSFVEHVGAVVGLSDDALFVSRTGGHGQGTWAHWHLALAYAKYLSHEFHLWANHVVRERMEGIRATPEIAANPTDPATILQVIQHLQSQVVAQGGRLIALDQIEASEGSRCISGSFGTASYAPEGASARTADALAPASIATMSRRSTTGVLERHPIMLDHMRRSLRRRDTGGIRLA